MRKALTPPLLDPVPQLLRPPSPSLPVSRRSGWASARVSIQVALKRYALRADAPENIPNQNGAPVFHIVFFSSFAKDEESNARTTM